MNEFVEGVAGRWTLGQLVCALGAEGPVMGPWEEKEPSSVCGGEGRLFAFHRGKSWQDPLGQVST